jgi:hypothetical protein
MFLSLPPKIRMSAIGTAIYDVEMIFKYMTFPYRNIRSIYKIHTFNLSMLFVCLSVTSKFLNSVTDCYKSSVNIMTALVGTTKTKALITDAW